MNTPHQILNFYLTVGELMQSHGASAYALTSLFEFCAKKFQLPLPQVLLFPETISISIQIDEVYYTGNCRFSAQSPHISSIQRLENFLHGCAEGTLPDKQTLIAKSQFPEASYCIVLLTCVVQCAATCRFFGGDALACFITIFAASASFISFHFFGQKKLNILLQEFLAALFASVVAYTGSIVLPTQTPLALLSASIIWLVPGLIMMNGSSDFFHGFVVSALNRCAQASMIVFALLLGILPALMHTQPEILSVAITPKIDWLWAGIASLSCAYRFEARGKLLLLSFLLGALGHGSRAFLVLSLGLDATTATFYSAFLVGLIIALLFFRTQIQYILVSIVTIGIIPLIPGAALLKSLYGLIQIALLGPLASHLQLSQTLAITIMALTQIGALAIGGILPTTFYRWMRAS